MADWIAIKGEYITTYISQRKLADKYHVSTSTIRNRARKEGWSEERNAFRLKMAKKSKDVVEQKEINRIERLLSLSDQLADKLEEAINQLDVYVTKDKKKTKVKRYAVNAEGDKEEIEETEDVEIISTMKASIDRSGLRLLTAALKDIKDVQADIGGTEEEYENSGLIDAIKSMGDLLEEEDDSYMLTEEEGEES